MSGFVPQRFGLKGDMVVEVDRLGDELGGTVLT
jgi:hypothetical protein